MIITVTIIIVLDEDEAAYDAAADGLMVRKYLRAVDV